MSQAGIGFDGFMEDLDVPSFLIGCREWVVGQEQVAGHPIENPRASIVVRKDLLGQDHRERKPFDVDLQGEIRFQ